MSSTSFKGGMTCQKSQCMVSISMARPSQQAPKAYTMTETRRSLLAVIRASDRQAAVAITRKKKTVSYLVSAARMESLLETLQIVKDRKAMKAIRDYRANKVNFHPLSVLDEDAG